MQQMIIFKLIFEIDYKSSFQLQVCMRFIFLEIDNNSMAILSKWKKRSNVRRTCLFENDDSKWEFIKTKNFKVNSAIRYDSCSVFNVILDLNL